jgi:hypothetical protein
MNGADKFPGLDAGANEAITSSWRLPPVRQSDGAVMPTIEQQQSGQYKKGRISLFGLQIAVENPRGSVRRGLSGGKVWECQMRAHYGYLVGTRGNDGDEIDVFVGPWPEGETVWVVNQKKPTGGFDEHKALLGFPNERMARDAYMLSYERGWKGLGSMVSMTIGQFKWWLRFGNKRVPLSPDQLPGPGMETMMDKVYWDRNAQPLRMDMADLMYQLRREDATADALLDAVTMDDLMEGEERAAMDAMVVQVGMLQRKMELLQRVMEQAGGSVKPVQFQISDPMRKAGNAHVAVIFELSDGQTVSIWFHNPDTTPARLSPADDLISWKWMLNRKDVTIVVAPERGQELNVREVSRRIMRLAEKNSAAFVKANGKRAERIAGMKSLEAQVQSLEAELTGLQAQIAAAGAAEVDRKAADIEAAKLDPTDPDVYARLLAQSKDNFDVWKPYQDALDDLFQRRIVDVRNALRELGWQGEQNAPLTKNDAKLEIHVTNYGGGANVVGVKFYVTGNRKPTATYGADGMVDDLSATPAELAALIDSEVALPAEPEPIDWVARVMPIIEARDVEAAKALTADELEQALAALVAQQKNGLARTLEYLAEGDTEMADYEDEDAYRDMARTLIRGGAAAVGDMEWARFKVLLDRLKERGFMPERVTLMAIRVGIPDVPRADIRRAATLVKRAENFGLSDKDKAYLDALGKRCEELLGIAEASPEPTPEPQPAPQPDPEPQPEPTPAPVAEVVPTPPAQETVQSMAAKLVADLTDSEKTSVLTGFMPQRHSDTVDASGLPWKDVLTEMQNILEAADPDAAQAAFDRMFIQQAIDGVVDFYDKGVTDRLAELAKKYTEGDMAALLKQAKSAAKAFFMAEFQKRAA